MNAKLLTIFSMLIIAAMATACTLDGVPGENGVGTGTLVSTPGGNGAGTGTPDTIAPSAPTNLSATTSFVHVSLTWQPSTDNLGVVGYEVFRDGTSIGTSPFNGYNDYSAVSQQTYTYDVLAFDAAGNKSTLSTPQVDATLPASPQSGAPVILYTDIVSGPTSGGENNNGAYLSIFGYNFGNPSALGNTTQLFIDDKEIADYILLKNALSQPTPNYRVMQQITVQVGSLNNTPASKTPLSIKLVVNGTESNTDKTFTIQPGDIYYVDNVNGDDATGIKNDPAKPFRFVQSKSVANGGSGNGVLDNNAKPGDFVVMRGTGTAWTDLVGQPGSERFIRFNGITGTEPTGTKGDGPITIMGYPGENVVIQCQIDTRCGIHGVDGYNLDGGTLAGYSDWITISNLRIRGGNARVKDGPINLQHRSDNWRIVNNELFEWDGNNKDRKILDANGIGINGNITTGVFEKGSTRQTFTNIEIVDGITPIGDDDPYNVDRWEYISGTILDKNGQVVVGKSYGDARAGGITGDGVNVKILGNHIHDINGGNRNHGIYIDGGTQNWEIAYNHMERLFGGNIIQTFDSHGNGIKLNNHKIENIDIHHNRLHEGSRYGINISSGTDSSQIYNNVIYNIAAAGLRFQTSSDMSIVAAHNTLYNNCLLDALNTLDTSSPTEKFPNFPAAIFNDGSGQNIKVQNNILHLDSSNCGTYILNMGSSVINIVDNNLYTGLSSGNAYGQDVNAVEGDPKFINTGVVANIADFGLGAGSPAINSAALFTDFIIPIDFLINLRDSSPDIGAIESQ